MLACPARRRCERVVLAGMIMIVIVAMRMPV